VRRTRVWAGLLGLQRVVVEDVQIGSEDEIVVAVRPVGREQDCCGVCRRRRPGLDQGEGGRRWRGLDLGTTLAFVEAEAPRVTCRRHGVVVCAVSWARHDSRITRTFEHQTAWLAVNTSQSAVAQLMRVAWRTVGAICARVCDEAQREVDLLDGLRRSRAARRDRRRDRARPVKRPRRSDQHPDSDDHPPGIRFHRGCLKSRRNFERWSLPPCPLLLGAFGARTKSERTGGTAMKKVSGSQVVSTMEALESPLPAEIQEALGELVGAAREGLLALI
jgi:hypothetical protein